jgi:uncharacterized protein (TIGR02145 family)
VHDDKYLQVEMDISGGTNYSDMGTDQMESVPYALMAGKAGNGVSSVSSTGDTLYLENESFIIIPGISSANHPNPGIVSNHSCGAQNIHNPDLTYGTMTDQEGNVYKTIVIGTQEWMAENLNTSRYRNGDLIPTNLQFSQWQSTNAGAWAYYDDSDSISCPYGKLYNGYACIDSRNLCPIGWHIPTDGEWTILSNFLGGESVAGGKLKTIGVQSDSSGLWIPWNIGATNSSGFSGEAGGVRDGNSYTYLMQLGYYWSSGSSTSSNLWSRTITFQSSAFIRTSEYKMFGFSVRCLRD